MRKMIREIEHSAVYAVDLEKGLVRVWVKTDKLNNKLAHSGPTGWIPVPPDVHAWFGKLILGTNCALTVEDATLLAEGLRTERLAELERETATLRNLVFTFPD